MNYRESQPPPEYKESFWEKCRRTNKALLVITGTIVKFCWKMLIPTTVAGVAIYGIAFAIMMEKNCAQAEAQLARIHSTQVPRVTEAARQWAINNPNTHITPQSIICTEDEGALDVEGCNPIRNSRLCYGFKNDARVDLICLEAQGCVVK